jgi:NRAMP (natural resistance-associated macrophage protein)-like metal ion transporter
MLAVAGRCQSNTSLFFQGGTWSMPVGLQSVKKVLGLLGPGLITGAADDDPSGIATYSQAGAQSGYALLWTALFMLPLQIVVQESCARIGAVTGKGLTRLMREHYNKPVLYIAVLLLLVANTINIGADIGALAAAAQLLLPLPLVLFSVLFTVLIILLEVLLPYRVYSRVLKWLAVSLLAYPLTALIISEPWPTILRATFLPHIELSFSFFFVITGVLGTTISPYMFFWQAAEETEEVRAQHLQRANRKPAITRRFIRNLRIDNVAGMVFSEIGTWAIIVVAATVLHSHGLTTIRTSADAARALEPLVHSFPQAGYLAKLIFATGIIGLGLLAIPVLAGSSSYALTEAFGWPEGLDRKLTKAWAFYGIIVGGTLIGLLLNFIGIDPVKALVYSAVINGLVAAPLLALIALMASNRAIMGRYRSGWLSRLLLWLTCLGMGAAALGTIATLWHP